MANLNQKKVGMLLAGFAVILILLLVFVKVDLDRRGAFICQAVHSNPDIEMSQCPVHQGNASWLIVAAFGMAFLIFGTGTYMVFMPLKQSEQEPGRIDMSRLDEEEKKVYNCLKQNEGSMYQNEIIKETGFSKVKMTRILDKMEGRKILERRRRGMANMVLLK